MKSSEASINKANKTINKRIVNKRVISSRNFDDRFSTDVRTKYINKTSTLYKIHHQIRKHKKLLISPSNRLLHGFIQNL